MCMHDLPMARHEFPQKLECRKFPEKPDEDQDQRPVALAPEGQTSVDLYRAAQSAGRPFDVVLLDLTVRGGMGGLATLAALRALDPAVKAVVMSGYSQEAILHEHTQHGFRAALTKPFNLDDLHHTLARVLAANPPKS